MQQLPRLSIGDKVELIAPASRCSDKELADLQELLNSWGLECVVAPDIFGDDLLCANNDANRFEHLKNALQNKETKAVICARGGYGCMRLIPQLSSLGKPKELKMFVGMSDVTALQLFMNQEWGWPVLHAALWPGKFSPESTEAVKSFLFGAKPEVQFNGVPLNKEARKAGLIKAPITGGNLRMIQSGIGTNWQLNAKGKMVFLEETGERGFRIDRMFEQLKQANILAGAKAIILGDFINGNEPNGTSLIQPVLIRFAEQLEIPVVQINGIGHDFTNMPLPLGTQASLQLGNSIQLNLPR